MKVLLLYSVILHIKCYQRCNKHINIWLLHLAIFSVHLLSKYYFKCRKTISNNLIYLHFYDFDMTLKKIMNQNENEIG